MRSLREVRRCLEASAEDFLSLALAGLAAGFDAEEAADPPQEGPLLDALRDSAREGWGDAAFELGLASGAARDRTEAALLPLGLDLAEPAADMPEELSGDAPSRACGAAVAAARELFRRVWQRVTTTLAAAKQKLVDLAEAAARLFRRLVRRPLRALARREWGRAYRYGVAYLRFHSPAIEGYIYHCRRDAHVCAHCLSLDGTFIPRSAARRCFPPQHLGCRCWVVPELAATSGAVTTATWPGGIPGGTGGEGQHGGEAAGSELTPVERRLLERRLRGRARRRRHTGSHGRRKDQRVRPQLELFMTALPAQGVTLQKTPDGKATLRGLPVLRPGTWNGRTYTAGDLAALAANFAEIRDTDGWTPPLRPRHQLSGDGQAISLDARETLAWHSALVYDPASGLLTADLEVVDADTVAALESGKLRYVSAEVVRSGYTSPVTGKQYDTPVYYGAAFVDNPAVKGMPWRLVVNAEELHGQPLAGTKDGDRRMSWLETLKSVLRKEGVADEELAAVDQLAVAPPPRRAATPVLEDGAGQEQAEQLVQLQQTVREQEAELQQLRQARAREAAQATVDRLVSEGTVPPALRVQCLALVEALSTLDSGVEVLAEGGTRTLETLEVLLELLAGLKPRLHAPASELWQGSEQLAEATPPLSEAALDKIAALAGGTPKGGGN